MIMGRAIEVPQEHEFECFGCVYRKKASESKKGEERLGCIARNEEPYKSCMVRKVKFVDKETYHKQDDVSCQRTKVRQDNLFGF